MEEGRSAITGNRAGLGVKGWIVLQDIHTVQAEIRLKRNRENREWGRQGGGERKEGGVGNAGD